MDKIANVKAQLRLQNREQFHPDPFFKSLFLFCGKRRDRIKYLLWEGDYLELCRRGYTVHIGKTNDGEIDFVAARQNEKIYVQVIQEIGSEKTEKREYNRLLEIHDNYPKYVLRADEFAGENYFISTEGLCGYHT